MALTMGGPVALRVHRDKPITVIRRVAWLRDGELGTLTNSVSWQERQPEVVVFGRGQDRVSVAGEVWDLVGEVSERDERAWRSKRAIMGALSGKRLVELSAEQLRDVSDRLDDLGALSLADLAVRDLSPGIEDEEAEAWERLAGLLCDTR